MYLPTILIVTNKTSTAQEAAELLHHHTSNDTTAKYHFAVRVELRFANDPRLCWYVFNPETHTTNLVPLNDLSDYDMIVVMDLFDFGIFSRHKKGAGSKLNMPIIWPGTDHHNQTQFNEWAQQSYAFEMIHAARDLR